MRYFKCHEKSARVVFLILLILLGITAKLSLKVALNEFFAEKSSFEALFAKNG